MNKTLKGIIGGSVLLALLGGGIAALKLTEPEAEPEESSDTAVVTELWNVSSEAIRKITVENPNGDSYSATRKMEKTTTTDMDGNESVIDVANYYLDGYEKLPMNTTGVRTLATRCPELASVDTAKENASDEELKQFGLDQPVKVQLDVDDADAVVFYIGSETPIDDCRYVMLEGDKTVYTVNGTAVAPYLEGIPYYLGKTLKEEQADDDDTIIESVRIEREDLDYDFLFEYDEFYAENINGGALAVHVMKEPVESLISADRSSGATHGLYGLTASEVLTPFPTAADKKAAGLDKPFATVTMKTSDNKTTVFYLGDKFEDANGETRYYGMLKDLDCIYSFNPEDIAYEDLTPEDVISRNVISTYVWDIGELICSNQEQELDFHCTATSKDDAVMTLNGADMSADEIERYRVFYTYLLETKAEDIVYEDVELPEKPIAEVTIKRQDGKKEEHFAYYDAGNLKAYIVVNGEVRFTCRKSYADVLADNINLFKEIDKKFTMTW
ncbi:MAG: DUF4340 domain-containing protein [Oscillospiraceae bacterium]|nr:DUF4340 domain-containing protein [Oscillospiraceae bacterium]